MTDLEKQKVEKSLLKFYSDVDDIANKIENCCLKGCSFCCHQSIEILSIETLLIESFLKKNIDETLLIKLRENLNKWLDYFDANTPQGKVLTIDDVYNVFRLKIGDDKIPCPFLVDNLCIIYPVRPLVCRTHLMQKSPTLCMKDNLHDASKESRILLETGLKYLSTHSKSIVILLPYAVLKVMGINRKTKTIQTIPFGA